MLQESQSSSGCVWNAAPPLPTYTHTCTCIPHCEICYLSCDCLDSIKAHTSLHHSFFLSILLMQHGDRWCFSPRLQIWTDVYLCSSGLPPIYKSSCMCVSITKWPKFPLCAGIHPCVCTGCHIYQQWVKNWSDTLKRCMAQPYLWSSVESYSRYVVMYIYDNPNVYKPIWPLWAW